MFKTAFLHKKSISGKLYDIFFSKGPVIIYHRGGGGGVGGFWGGSLDF